MYLRLPYVHFSTLGSLQVDRGVSATAFRFGLLDESQYRVYAEFPYHARSERASGLFGVLFNWGKLTISCLSPTQGSGEF
jgi:hypothetical protein